MAEDFRPLTVAEPAIPARIVGRTSVFLDMSAWIQLVESKNPAWQECRRLLTAHVDRGRLVCPLSFGAAGELMYQSHDSARRLALIMEGLSLGACFLPAKIAFGLETLRFLDGLRLGESRRMSFADVCGPIRAFASLGGGIEFPEACVVPEERREWFTAMVAERLSKVGLVEWIDLLGARLPLCRPSIPDSLSRQERARARFAYCRGDFHEVFREELAYLFREEVFPLMEHTIRELPPGEQRTVHERCLQLRANLAGERFEAFLADCPAIRMTASVNAVAGMDINRKDRSNDFFDIDNLMVPYAYAAAFVIQDRWVTHLVKEMSRRSLSSDAVFIDDPSSLQRYLAARPAPSTI